jgi:hypothetical protein
MNDYGYGKVWLAVVSSILLLVLITWIDYATGYEFGFFIFYFIPVAISAWFAGRGKGLFFAAIAAVCWYWSDKATHHPYSRPYLIYWETFMRLISFVTTAFTISRIREMVENEQRLTLEMAEIHAELRELRQKHNDSSPPDSSRQV